MKGPSVTLGLPPKKETRAPIEGGWRPSRASRTPACCRASLYFIMALTASASGMVPGAAASYPLGIISIMNRILVTLSKSPCSRPSRNGEDDNGISSRRHVDHPGDAEAVGDHTEARREEGFAQRHLHLSAIAQRSEQAFGFPDIG